MLFATIFILFIVFLITTYYYYKFYYSVVKNRIRLPGLEPEWFFGSIRNSGLTSGRVLHEVLDLFKRKYGDVFSFWLGPYHAVALSRIEHVQHVLIDRQTYNIATRTTKSFGILFPNSLIALRGDACKRHARFILLMLKRAKISSHTLTLTR